MSSSLPDIELPADIPNYVEHFATGSRVICNPAPTDTDCDIMVLVEEGALKYAVADLLIQKWKVDNQYGFLKDNWFSAKKGEYNLLVTDDQKYFTNFLDATVEAKKLNLTNKKDRIALFRKYCD